MSIKYSTFALAPLFLFSCAGNDQIEETENHNTDTSEEIEIEAEDTLDSNIYVAIIEDCVGNECEPLNLDNQSAGDVVVRLEAMSSGENEEPAKMYHFYYYHDYNGEIEEHGGLISAEIEYDQVLFQWEDDTTIAFTLENSKTEEKYAFKLFGNGGTNGMTVPDTE